MELINDRNEFGHWEIDTIEGTEDTREVLFKFRWGMPRK